MNRTELKNKKEEFWALMDKLDKAYTHAYKIGKTSLSTHKRKQVLAEHASYYNASKKIAEVTISLFKALEKYQP